jgi:hypothetical protein
VDVSRYRDRLFLAMADTGTHAAFFAANLSPTFARLLHSHEILSNKQLRLCTSSDLTRVCRDFASGKE